MIQKNIPSKYTSRPVTYQEDILISKLSREKKISYLEAKHIYFSKQLTAWL
jgi:hypothetical protein